MSNLSANNKDAQIIQYLYENLHTFVSSQMIGDHINVSDRTARKYMKNVKSLLKNYGATVETKKGYGYQLQIADMKAFNNIFEDMQADKHNMTDVFSITEAKDRERYILNKIFLENENLTVDEYATELFVSKSTIMHVIQSIRSQLEHFDLVLNNSTNDGLSVDGPEVEKRRFILNYFFNVDALDHFLNFNDAQLSEINFSLETLFIIVLEECRNGEIQVSDYVMQNLVLHLALAIIRIRAGNTIDAFKAKQNLDLSNELDIANRIIERVEEVVDIQFPSDEAHYVALHLKSKANQNNQDNLEGQASELQEQIMAVLKKMRAEGAVEFSLDTMLLMGLEAHFEPLATRLKMGIPMKNPLLDEIQEKYLAVFNETKLFFQEMPILAGYEIDNHEWAYITLHMLAAVERYHQSQRLKVIVICSTGLGSAQMLRDRLENEFGTSIQITDVISYYQLNDRQLEDVDLIISTIDISTSLFTIPVVRVSVFLNGDDIREINHYLKGKSNPQANPQPAVPAVNVIEELFDTYFSEERYFVIEEKVTREQLLTKMVERLTDCHNEQFVAEFIKHVELRERFGSLAFSDTLAFPHPSIPLGVHSELAVAVVPEGLQWDEEHPNVKFVVLMSPSKVANKGLSEVTNYFVKLVDNEADQATLLADPSYESFKFNFIKNQTRKKEQ